MSVLTKLVSERQEWADRQKVLVARQTHTRVITEYLMLWVLFMLPYLAFLFRDDLELLFRHLLHYWYKGVLYVLNQVNVDSWPKAHDRLPIPSDRNTSFCKTVLDLRNRVFTRMNHTCNNCGIGTVSRCIGRNGRSAFLRDGCTGDSLWKMKVPQQSWK